METSTTSDAQQLLSRAWSSKYYRQPANYLRLLVAVLAEIGTPRKVYARQANKALESGSIQQIEAATLAAQGEINRLRAAREQARQVAPRLYRTTA